MPRKESGPDVDRRKFLTGVAVAGAVVPGVARAATSSDAPTATVPKARPSALPPNEKVAVAETGVPDIGPYAGHGRPGSDFMVDVIKTLDIKYLPSNRPRASAPFTSR